VVVVDGDVVVVVVVAGATVVVVVAGATVVVVVIDGDVDTDGIVDEVFSIPLRHGELLDIAPIIDIKRTGTRAITERLRAEICTNRLTQTPAIISTTATTRRPTSLPAAGNLQISALNTSSPHAAYYSQIDHFALNTNTLALTCTEQVRPKSGSLRCPHKPRAPLRILNQTKGFL